MRTKWRNEREKEGGIEREREKGESERIERLEDEVQTYQSRKVVEPSKANLEDIFVQQVTDQMESKKHTCIGQVLSFVSNVINTQRSLWITYCDNFLPLSPSLKF